MYRLRDDDDCRQDDVRYSLSQTSNKLYFGVSRTRLKKIQCSVIVIFFKENPVFFLTFNYMCVI